MSSNLSDKLIDSTQINQQQIEKRKLTNRTGIVEELDEAEIVAGCDRLSVLGDARRVDVGDVHVRLPYALTCRSEHAGERAPAELLSVFVLDVDACAARRLEEEELASARVGHEQFALHIPLDMRNIAASSLANAHAFAALHVVDVDEIFVTSHCQVLARN